MIERPSRLEAGGILLACIVVLVALAWLDANAVVGREHRAPGAPPGAAAEPRERGMALAWLVLIAGAGLAMAVTGARVLSRRWA